MSEGFSGGGADWDGPLDLLLAEVRAGRVDLSALSMTALIDRCLAAFAALPMTAKADQIGLAATMTELKSRLLLPQPEAEESDEAAQLRRRLEHLILIRQAADALTARDQLGREVFARGMPEVEAMPELRAPLDLTDLIRTYARLRLTAEADAPLEIRRILAMTMGEALATLGGRLEKLDEWTALAPLMKGQGEVSARSRVAASLMAALEMVRRGEVEIRQDGDGVMVRRR